MSKLWEKNKKILMEKIELNAEPPTIERELMCFYL